METKQEITDFMRATIAWIKTKPLEAEIEKTQLVKNVPKDVLNEICREAGSLLCPPDIYAAYYFTVVDTDKLRKWLNTEINFDIKFIIRSTPLKVLFSED